jgi:hypothetical protein
MLPNLMPIKPSQSILASWICIHSKRGPRFHNHSYVPLSFITCYGGNRK